MMAFIPAIPSFLRHRHHIPLKHTNLTSNSVPACSLSGHLQRTAAAAAAAALILINTGIPFTPSTAPSTPSPTSIVKTSSDNNQDHEILSEVVEIIRKHYIDRNAASKLASTAVIHGHEDVHLAIKRVLKQLDDPYTKFLEPKDVRKLSKFDVSGVGLLLAGDGTGNLFVAATPEADTAAGRAGIRKGDIVRKIDGMDLKGVTAFQAAEIMQGDEGALMVVEVEKKGVDDYEESGRDIRRYELVRNYKVASPVSYRMIKVPVNIQGSEKENERAFINVGYVQLKEFNASCRLGVQHALEELEKMHPEGYILDLRSNPGGVFEGAVEIAGLFMGNSVPVAHVISGAGKVEDFVSRAVGHNEDDYTTVPRSTPMVVLLNGLSASSSEVLAGALRDNCRAMVVGEKSYGKGLIQGVFSISDGSGLIATVAKYQTPGGKDIQGHGIKPDFEQEEGVVELMKSLVGIERKIPEVDWNDVRHGLDMCKTGEAL